LEWDLGGYGIAAPIREAPKKKEREARWGECVGGGGEKRLIGRKGDSGEGEEEEQEMPAQDDFMEEALLWRASLGIPSIVQSR